MSHDIDDQTRFTRVATVERSLGADRRLVQPLDAQVPTQLAGSAPIIWDLLAERGSVNEVLAELQRVFSDAPEVIAGGIRAAFAMFLDSGLMVAEGVEQ